MQLLDLDADLSKVLMSQDIANLTPLAHSAWKALPPASHVYAQSRALLEQTPPTPAPRMRRI